MDLGLRGKSVVVTGGTRGIGLAICKTMAEEGCQLAICGRGEKDLDAARETLRAAGAEVYAKTVDVTDAEALKSFVDGAAERFGGINVLVANVGGSSGGALTESTDEDWFRTFDLNLFHSVRATRMVLPHMEASGGGAVAIISSISGWKPAPKAQYGCAKAAEMFLAGALALELAPKRIRVNTICPGSILFPGGSWDRYQKRDPGAFERFIKGDFPLNRLGTPEEIANVVAFVCSGKASWVNGASIAVDGAQIKPSAFWL